jgi:hypothetical protein
MLHIAEDDEPLGPSASREIDELLPHRLGAARNLDALLAQLLFESDVQVGDHEGVVRLEDGLVRDRLEVHVDRRVEFA